MAEVLITLGIIGVVAAKLLPSLMNNIQDRQFRAKWKKAYSTISNVVQSASLEYEFCKGTNIEYNGTISLCNAEQIIETYRQILAKFDLADVCSFSYSAPLGVRVCSRNEFEHILNGSPKCKSLSGDFDGYCANDAAGAIATLKDGTRLYFAMPVWDAPKVLVDVNGPALPNTIGRDMFVAKLVKNKVIPYGSEEYGKNSNICSKSSVSSPLFGNFSYASGSGLSGAGCSSEYLYK